MELRVLVSLRICCYGTVLKYANISYLIESPAIFSFRSDAECPAIQIREYEVFEGVVGCPGPLAWCPCGGIYALQNDNYQESF